MRRMREPRPRGAPLRNAHCTVCLVASTVILTALPLPSELIAVTVSGGIILNLIAFAGPEQTCSMPCAERVTLPSLGGYNSLNQTSCLRPAPPAPMPKAEATPK